MVKCVQALILHDTKRLISHHCCIDLQHP